MIVARKNLPRITNWSRRVVMKMIRDIKNEPFVCMDDVSGQVEAMNYVIYNPSKESKETSINNLKKRISERFRIILTDIELDRLTNYSVFELNDFANDLRQIIQTKKKEI